MLAFRPDREAIVDAITERLALDANHARFRGQAGGHYESYFLRANHPSRPLAFWIRYTIFSPKHRPQDAVGELWAIHFDGETGRHSAAKQQRPIGDCAFSPTGFDVRVGEATLAPGAARGEIAGAGPRIGWDLAFSGGMPPLFLLPPRLYEGSFPAAKSLVAQPMARFSGTLAIDGAANAIDGWIGSQNHNWGSRHTDLYAWGQVAGFDSHPDSFLEVATARLRLGPFWSPPITPLALRHAGREFALTGLPRALGATGRFGYFDWEFSSRDSAVEIAGRISAPKAAFVGLLYGNPPGGVKQCLNSKIASCRLEVTDRRTGRRDILETASRAAFEILTDDSGHGVEPAA